MSAVAPAMLVGLSVVFGLEAPAGLSPEQRAPVSARVVELRAPPPERIRLPGGTFIMGSTWLELTRAFSLCRQEVLGAECEVPMVQRQFRNELQAHTVTLSPFEIDRTEVSVGAYQRCVSAGACDAPGFPLGDKNFDRPDLPVTFVDWNDAQAYCTWTGGRLPTEAEWEFTARGIESRIFPWGNVYNPHLCNHGSIAVNRNDKTDGYLGLAPVDSFHDGATPEGILNLAGNVAEWVADFVDAGEGDFPYPAGPQKNPKGPTSGNHHIIRGGHYQDGSPWMRAAARHIYGMGRLPVLGFRCARDP
jgi:sulfatase modifying factor 1